MARNRRNMTSTGFENLRLKLPRGAFVVACVQVLMLYIWMTTSLGPQCNLDRANDLVQRVHKAQATRVQCDPGTPCQYPEEVDFRIIVITLNNPQSMQKLLVSLELLELDGASASLEVWVNRFDGSNDVDCATLELLSAFRWSRGQFRVHVHREHVGTSELWTDAWCPRDNGKELAVILHDDMSVSPYMYRWLRAAHLKYGSETDIAGYSVQSEKINREKGIGSSMDLQAGEMVYLSTSVGPWGFAPRPQSWTNFQKWFHLASKDKDIQEYGTVIIDQWQKDLESIGKPVEKWTLWHMYHNDMNTLCTVYNNIEMASSEKNVALSVNRDQSGVGVFYKEWWSYLTERAVPAEILDHWSDQYVEFPDNPVRFYWDGTKLS